MDMYGCIVEVMIVVWFMFCGGMQIFRLLESGGTVFNCTGDEKGCALTCKLRILRPAFYWKVSTCHLIY